MQFSIGDKVVHPHHGPGHIVDVEKREFLEGEKWYYAIEIPVHAVTVHMPVQRATELGLRPAVSRAQIAQLLDRLGSRPHRLPQDFKVRQEAIWEKIRACQPIPTAEAVRDLTWRKRHEHLTKKDTELLQRGQGSLAAEMALVLGTEITEANESIEAALDAPMLSMAEEGYRRQPLAATRH